MELEVKIRGLMMDPVTNMPVVVLKEAQGTGILPIWVGVYEANAIALEIEKVQTPRPMTHDLLKNVLTGLNVHVQKVVVSDLRDDTFYALIWMERDGQTMSMDSRPSHSGRARSRVLPPSASRRRLPRHSYSAHPRSQSPEISLMSDRLKRASAKSALSSMARSQSPSAASNRRSS